MNRKFSRLLICPACFPRHVLAPLSEPFRNLLGERAPAAWSDFPATSPHQQDDHDAGDRCSNRDDYFLDKGAGKSGFFNTRGGGRPMPPDADRRADIDPVVEPLGRIGARQRQANATVRSGMSRDLLESVNENVLVHLHAPWHRCVMIKP